jgi:hypothetical protein
VRDGIRYIHYSQKSDTRDWLKNMNASQRSYITISTMLVSPTSTSPPSCSGSRSMEGVVHTDMIQKLINNGISLLWVFVCTVCRTALTAKDGNPHEVNRSHLNSKDIQVYIHICMVENHNTYIYTSGTQIETNPTAPFHSSSGFSHRPFGSSFSPSDDGCRRESWTLPPASQRYVYTELYPRLE